MRLRFYLLGIFHKLSGLLNDVVFPDRKARFVERRGKGGISPEYGKRRCSGKDLFKSQRIPII